ncbi:MAG: hypothetical protein WBM91_14220 [Eudoraea sp.]|jgi:hypothetical protein|uniref:hypothetical protein n=1 Tax=Eudoraea sp. TaxID=1979955 RepID=UPI003C76ED6C
MEELTLYESRNTEGGVLIGPPPRFIINVSIAVGKTANAWWSGFKNGTELF